MNLELFSRPITEKEITERYELKIVPPPQQALTGDETTKLDETDCEMLDAVLKLISISNSQLHISYHAKEAFSPLVSVYISCGRLIAFEYSKQGIMALELLALQDAKKLLGKYMTILPMYDRAADQVETLDIRKEEATNAFLHEDDPEKKILVAQWMIDGHKGPSYFLKKSDKHLDGMIIDEKVTKTSGSAFPVFYAINKFLLLQYTKNLKNLEI